jgi:Tol biopolymer transport system component
MNDTGSRNSRLPATADGRDRLNSWKRVAAHFNRDVTTVQRWERREGMPVHRHLHDKQGSVYALRSELDAWWEGRGGKLTDPGEIVPRPALEEALIPSEPAPTTTALEFAMQGSPETPIGGFRLQLRRQLSVVAIIAAALLLIYGIFKVSNPMRETWRNPLANATFTRLTDWSGREQAAAISPDGRWASFLADRDGHTDAWLTQVGSGSYRNITQGKFPQLVNPSVRTLGFTADGSLATVWTRSADGSHSEDIKLLATPPNGGELRELLPGAAEAAWSHDGKKMLYHTTAPGDPLFVRDQVGVSRRIYIAPSGVHCHFPLWSGDDAYIYFARGTPPDGWDIWRIRPSGQDLERITFHNAQVSHPVFLDGHTLAYLASDAQGAGPWLYALNVEQRVPHRISFGLERYGSLAASASGMRLVATVQESQISIWSVPLNVEPGGKGSQRATPSISSVLSTGFSPRVGPDFLLYISTRAGQQGIWKTQDGQSRELWSDARAAIVGGPALSPDGRQIAFTAAEGEQTVLYVMDSDGNELRGVARSLQLRGDPAWAPDGRSIVASALRDGEPRLMSVFWMEVRQSRW